ncbi:hypothetical protein PO909_014775 [Leuciscus waleckii]
MIENPSIFGRPGDQRVLDQTYCTDALTQQMGTAAVTQFTFAQAVQKWLRYAPDRAGGTGRQTIQTSEDHEL